MIVDPLDANDPARVRDSAAADVAAGPAAGAVREWMDFVAERAQGAVGPAHEPARGPIALRLLYLYDEVAIDVDDILKPIQDALIGIVFEDDSVVTDAEIRRRRRGTTFTLNAVSPVLAAGLQLGREIVYVMISDAPPQDVLP